MTKDEVIELAKQAGFADGIVEIVGLYGFMKFAKLVAAAEREECAKLCEAQDTEFSINAEWMRERCAVAIRARETHD